MLSRMSLSEQKSPGAMWTLVNVFLGLAVLRGVLQQLDLCSESEKAFDWAGN